MVGLSSIAYPAYDHPADPVDPQVAEVLKPFSSLTPAEVAVLPVEVQFRVPTIGCAQLAARPANSIQDTNAVVVACASEPAPTKYLLDIAKVGGPEVKKASATQERDAPRPGVMLAFTPAGQQKWTALTREAYNNEGARCASDALGSGTHCLVGIVLDNQVISAPEIQGVITGDASSPPSSLNAMRRCSRPRSATVRCRLRSGW